MDNLSRSPGRPQLGVDIGTSNTAAAVRAPAGAVKPVLFDGVPLLSSAVLVDGGTVLVGADAQHAARTHPDRLEPNPKLRIDDGSVLLGEHPVGVETLLAAILTRVRVEAERMTGTPVGQVTMAYPASWGPRRLATLTGAARLAGLPGPRTVYEPVAAAAHFVTLPDVDLRDGHFALVYDLGAGTFDATVIRRTATGFDVVASQGLPDAGGLDIDAAIVASINANLRPDDPAWQRLGQPRTAADYRARRELWSSVRSAKELLSRVSSTSVYVPLVDVDVPFGREQLDVLARPLLGRTVTAARAVVRDAGLTERDLAAVFLVGGSTRIPLVGTLLHQAFDRAPTTLDQPELAVAYGSVAVDRAVPAPGAVAAPADAAASGWPGPATVWPAVGGQPPAARRPWRLPRSLRGPVMAAGLVLTLVLGSLAVAALWRGLPPDRPDAAAASSSSAAGASPIASAQGPSAAGPPSPSSAPRTAARVIPASFGGRWQGTARQRGGVVSSWRGVFNLPAGRATGTLQVASLGCTATLPVVAPEPTDRELHLRQRTTRDPRRICAEAADIHLVLNTSDKVDMFWVQFGVPTNTSTAILTRA